MIMYRCHERLFIVTSILNGLSLSLSFLQPPVFDPDTTDDPNFYLIRFSRITGEDVLNLNISASDPRMAPFTNLAKGTEYIARIDAVNDVGNGTLSNFVQQETLVDRKLLFLFFLFYIFCIIGGIGKNTSILILPGVQQLV